MWSQSAWSRHRVPQLVTVDGAAETRHFDHTAVQCHSLSPCFHLQGWTPDLLTRFDEAVKEQGGIHLAKAKRTFEQMKCEGEQDAPTKIHIKSRISRLRTAENGRSSASAGLVTCSHPERQSLTPTARDDGTPFSCVERTIGIVSAADMARPDGPPKLPGAGSVGPLAYPMRRFQGKGSQERG